MAEKVGFCSLCRSRCGTVNSIENGRLLEVRPNRSHPTGRAICPKGRAGPEIAHSPRRLTRPLRRTRDKDATDPAWKEISWDDALAEITERLDRCRRESGPESVAFSCTSQSSSPISDGTDWIQRFFKVFGSPNACMAVENCNWHKDYGHAFTFGRGLTAPDYAHADLIVLWGADPANSWLAQADAIGEARSRGAKLIVVDPHKSGSATSTDLWCRIRPGTDGALALAVSRILLQRERFNQGFVRKWSNAPYLVHKDSGLFIRGADFGWKDSDAYIVWALQGSGAYASAGAINDQTPLNGSGTIPTPNGQAECCTAFDFFVEACRPYSPEHASEICGVPSRDIERMADLYADARAVCYYAWTGIAQHTNASQTDRAVAILHALTGSFDAPGGNVLFTKHPVRGINQIALLRPEQRAKALGFGARPLGPPSLGWITGSDLCTAILDKKPYGIRALVGFGANILVTQPEPDRTRAALTALEFQVHCDLFMNPTAEFADIVLPVNSLWERESLRVGFEISQEAEQLVQLRQKMIPPVGESRSDMEIIFDLACRLGLSDEFFEGSLDAGWNHILAPIGLTVADLRKQPEGIYLPLTQEYRKYARNGFSTDTGKVEIYSELFKRHGYDPVPNFVPPNEPTSATFPYALTSANRGNFCHSQHRGITSLRRRTPNPEVTVSPEVARSKGLRSGGWADIVTRVGKARMKVRVDEMMERDTIVADYGFWESCPDLGLAGGRPGDPEGGNYNNLISSAFRDPISGAIALRSFACDVRPANQQPWEGFRELVVVRRQAEGDGVVTFEFAAPNREELPAFFAGQYLTLRSGRLVRSYSLTGAAEAQPRSYVITVKNIGVFSRMLTETVNVGDKIEVKSPCGNFLLPLQNELPVVFIAAGIGITPFMSALRTLRGATTEPDITLYYGSRNRSSRIFADELDAIAGRHSNVKIVHFSSASERNDCDIRGRITAASISNQLVDSRARFYMCGPNAMMRDLFQGLLQRGVMKSEMFQERFQSATSAIDIAEGNHEIRFARSGGSVRWRRELGTILSCAERVGLQLPNGCRVGQCESCSARILDGAVQHLVDVVADDGECLTCQAVPTSDLVLDI